MKGRAQVAVCVLCAETVVSGCYTTLDPAPLDGREEDGVLPTCSFADSDATRYVVCSEQLPYVDAKADCEKRGAQLAAIASQEENDFIGMRVFAVVTANVWLGGTRADNLVWSWPDGSVFWRGAENGSVELGAFARWQQGEPNDASTVTTDPERCLVLVGGDYAWNDRSCSLALPYVCEQTL